MTGSDRIRVRMSSRSPNGAAASKPSMSRPIGEYSEMGTASSRATRKRLRMSRTMSAIDIEPCPPWPIASWGDETGEA